MTTHVDPMVFWQSACGGRDLSRHDYLHLLACPDCTALAGQIGRHSTTLTRYGMACGRPLEHSYSA
jgi:hypothetical protein